MYQNDGLQGKPGRGMQSITQNEVKERIEQALPGSVVEVSLFAEQDHFQALVEAPQFEGKSLVEQHRMVYAALEGLIGGPMHALALKTRAPSHHA